MLYCIFVLLLISD